MSKKTESFPNPKSTLTTPATLADLVRLATPPYKDEFMKSY